MEDSESILEAAEEIIARLQEHGIDAVIIGAVALAAYHYVRQTEDIDFGVNAYRLADIGRLLGGAPRTRCPGFPRRSG